MIVSGIPTIKEYKYRIKIDKKLILMNHLKEVKNRIEEYIRILLRDFFSINSLKRLYNYF